MRLILDTNIFVSALKSNMGASYAIISQLPSDQFQIALTIPLYIEYQDVLTRPEHMSGTSTKEEILGFLRYVCGIAHRQQIFFSGVRGSKIRRMTWFWKRRLPLGVGTLSLTTSEISEVLKNISALRR